MQTGLFSVFFNGKQSFLFFLNGKVLSLSYISFHPVRAGIFIDLFVCLFFCCFLLFSVLILLPFDRQME